MAENPVARRYELAGRVQGVGFRWWTRSLARELNLSGSVRNRADGSVEIVAAGGIDALDNFESRLRNGPPGAVVKTLDSADAELPAAGGFEIKH